MADDRLGMIEARLGKAEDQLREQVTHLREVHRCMAVLQRQVKSLEATAGLRHESTMTAWPAHGRGD